MRAREAAGPGSDGADGVSTLADGSMIVTGSFEETVTFAAGDPEETTLTSAGDADIFLACYDAEGDLQ